MTTAHPDPPPTTATSPCSWGGWAGPHAAPGPYETTRRQCTCPSPTSHCSWGGSRARGWNGGDSGTTTTGRQEGQREDGRMGGQREDGDNDGRRVATPSWVERWGGEMRGRGDNGGWGTPPPPPLRAPARRVGAWVRKRRGDEKGHDAPHTYEHLLVGWFAG
jgi:hypothetical protein